MYNFKILYCIFKLLLDVWRLILVLNPYCIHSATLANEFTLVVTYKHLCCSILKVTCGGLSGHSQLHPWSQDGALQCISQLAPRIPSPHPPLPETINLFTIIEFVFCLDMFSILVFAKFFVFFRLTFPIPSFSLW